MIEKNFLEMTDVFPQRFDFYHLGEVQLQTVKEPLQDASAIGFRLVGDFVAIIVILYPRELDSSVYSELGNILASRIATQLNLKNGVDTIISAPFPLNEPQVNRLVQCSSIILRRRYCHSYDQSVIPVEALVLPAPPEGIGYA